MKSGAEGGVAAAQWPRARGGDYGQEFSLPAAALLLAGSSGLGWGFWGLHIPPSAEETHGSPGLVVLLLWRRWPAGSCCLLLGSCQ